LHDRSDLVVTSGSKHVVATVTKLLQPFVVDSFQQVARPLVCDLL
jgi:hypothetical protein